MINLVGQTFDRYYLIEQIGRGGMAAVYKAFDTRLNRNVAIKVILPSHEQSSEFLKRFEREAKTLAQLNHPNIVNVHDYGEHNGMPYLVMEYLPGGTLKEKMGSPIPYQQAARILLPIAQALAYAHKHKIVHRDIKPSNILMTESGQPMLTDFGIAKILEVSQTVALTQTGVGIGTPEYMAPEQGMGKSIDHRADIYALGVVFYELVTGRKPYVADTPMAVMLMHITEPLPRPIKYIPQLPEAVEQVIFKAMAKEPADRYQTMDAFVAALEHVIYTQPAQKPQIAEVQTEIYPRQGTGTAVPPTRTATPATTPQTQWEQPPRYTSQTAPQTYAQPVPQPVRRKGLSTWAIVGIIASILVIGICAIFVGIPLLGGLLAVAQLPTDTVQVRPTKTRTRVPTRTAVPTDTPRPTPTAPLSDISSVSLTLDDLPAGFVAMTEQEKMDVGLDDSFAEELASDFENASIQSVAAYKKDDGSNYQGIYFSLIYPMTQEDIDLVDTTIFPQDAFMEMFGFEENENMSAIPGSDRIGDISAGAQFTYQDVDYGTLMGEYLMFRRNGALVFMMSWYTGDSPSPLVVSAANRVDAKLIQLIGE